MAQFTIPCCFTVGVIGIICCVACVTIAIIGPLVLFEPEGEVVKEYGTMFPGEQMSYVYTHTKTASGGLGDAGKVGKSHQKSQPKYKAHIEVLSNDDKNVHSYLYEKTLSRPSGGSHTWDLHKSGNIKGKGYETVEMHFQQNSDYRIEYVFSHKADFYLFDNQTYNSFVNSHHVAPIFGIQNAERGSFVSSPLPLDVTKFAVLDNYNSTEELSFQLDYTINGWKYALNADSSDKHCTGDCKFRNVPQSGLVVVEYAGSDEKGPKVSIVVHDDVPGTPGMLCICLGAFFALVSIFGIIAGFGSVHGLKQMANNPKQSQDTPGGKVSQSTDATPAGEGPSAVAMQTPGTW